MVNPALLTKIAKLGIMSSQEIQLDDRMAIDSYISNGSSTTNTTASSSYDIKTAKVNYEKKKQETITKQKKHFLLCESCFWCASSICKDGSMNRICPVCNHIKVQSIPI
jgi:rubrerythrin